MCVDDGKDDPIADLELALEPTHVLFGQRLARDQPTDRELELISRADVGDDRAENADVRISSPDWRLVVDLNLKPQRHSRSSLFRTRHRSRHCQLDPASNFDDVGVLDMKHST